MTLALSAIRLLFAAVLLAAWPAMAPAAFAQAGSQAVVLATDPDRLVARTGAGEFSFSIEIADEDRERQQGLMFRETMAADHGMLFDFDGSRVITMWMKNTPMPLDMVFLRDDGTVVAIAERTTPFSEATISSGEAAAYVLELRAGVSRLIGLKPGLRLEHPVFSR